MNKLILASVQPCLIHSVTFNQYKYINNAVENSIIPYNAKVQWGKYCYVEAKQKQPKGC